MKEVGPGARRWMPCVNNALGGWILCLIIKHAGYFGIFWDIVGYYGILWDIMGYLANLLTLTSLQPRDMGF